MKKRKDLHSSGVRILEPGEKRKARAWNVYIVALRSFLAKAECYFEFLGQLVATNAWKTIFTCVIITALFSFGLMRMQVESRTSKLFVPQNSIAEQALKKGKPFFANSLNTRTEEIILVAKNRTNVLEETWLREAFYVMEMVKNISGYRDLCKPRPKFVNAARNVFSRSETCDVLNPIEMLDSGRLAKDSIYNRLKYSLALPNRLMSNGRAAVFNVKYGLANFALNETSSSVYANGIRVLFFMKTEEERPDILRFEKKFIATMSDVKAKLKHSKLVFAAESSLDDAINESTSREIPLVAATFSVMFTFSCLMLGKFINPVRGHTWLAFFGVISTGMGILAGMGLTMALGVPFINLVGVLPFLVVSIGIDDMFIIVDEFDRQSSSNVPSNRVSYALSKVGATITMTTVTDCIAFFATMTSAFPAIRYFCSFAAVCITLEFLLQITLFVAFLSLDATRIHKSRNDCCPMITVPDKTCYRLPNQFSFSEKIMNSYAGALLKNPSKVFVCLLSLALIAFGVYGCLNINNEFNRKALASEGSNYMEYLTEFERTFPQTIPVSLEVTNKLNYSDPAVRNEFANVANIAFDTGYYMNRNLTWVHYFNDFCRSFNIPANGSDFKPALKLFLSLPVYQQHNLDIILDKQGNIVASRVLVFLKDNPKASFQKAAMLTLRKQLELRSSIDFHAAADPFIYFEQYAIINEEVIKNLVSVSIVILLILIPFCIHPLVIFFIFFGFASLIVELIGWMYLWNIELNAISMINIIMAVGFSVDYSAHIAHAFTVSREKKVNNRIIDAISTIGTSVLLGATSTFLGMSVTGFSSSHIFQVFFKMFVGIIIFGLYNGMVALPVLLSIFSKFIDMNTKDTVMPNFKIKTALKSIFCCFKDAILNNNNNKAAGVKDDTISVMGMSARFSNARNKEEFWKLLTEGVNTTTDYPNDRYARFKYFEADFNPTRPLGGRLYVSKGSYMDNIEAFDNKFFGISSTEARSMDPQQRLLLQGTFEAIEDAGMKLEELQSCCTGVYVGIMNLDYGSVVLRDDYILKIDQFASTGTAFSIAANRLSFALNLNGPSVATDTACSSSLTALSIACDNLERKVVDVAIVAAANLILCPKKQVTICRANMLSPDGKCKVFDERADGYGRGEGIVVFVLKRSDLVDRSTEDPYCEILGWGVNNDGQAAAPITAPSVDSQHGLMKSVLLKANVNPKDVQYVEMHGTGTIIGDLVETKSVGESYGKSRRQNAPLLIGSVKSNVNHTESTAGLAGLAKVCLMLKHKQIVATVGIENQSARLGITDKSMHVQVKNTEWPEHDSLPHRMAAVNSFGYGGSNAHLVVREASPLLSSKDSHGEQINKDSIEKSGGRILVLSARSQSALEETAASFGKWLSALPDDSEHQMDVSYTLFERRTEHSFRLAVSAPTLSTASKLLTEFAENSEMKNTGICGGKTTMQCASVGFVFGGQGSQWRGMAGDVLSHPKILAMVKKIDKIARKQGYKESLLEYLQEDDNNKDRNAQDESEESFVTVQLSIFALQYAVAQFLMHNAGITPMAVGGHSLGDITAACIAGIVKPKEAVKIILARASLQAKCQAEGAMAAIALPPKEITKIVEDLDLSDQLCIAAINDKSSVTISGDVDAIERMTEHFKLELKDVFFRKLDTQKAFHSHHMEGIKSEFMKLIKRAKIKPKANHTAFISSTKGQKVYGNEIEDDYWWKNLREAVLFNNCAKGIYEEGCTTIIEVSPRPVLSYYMKAIAKQNELDDIIVMQALPARKEKRRLEHFYVQCIGKMYTFGYPITVGGLQEHRNGKFIRYPAYPWQETDIWAKDEFRVPNKTLPFLGLPTQITAKLSSWENQIDLHRFEYLSDHTMENAGIIMPGACYVELALEAALWDTNVEPVVVKDLAFKNTLALHERMIRPVKFTKEQSVDERYFDFNAINCDDDVLLSSAKLFLFHQKTSGPSLTLAEAMGAPTEAVDEPYPESKSESSSEVKDDFIGTDSLDDASSETASSREAQSESSGIVEDVLNTIGNTSLDGLKETAPASDKNSPDVSSDDDKQICVYGTTSVEDAQVLNKVALDYDRELSATEFKELAAKTGFDFGKTFSLIQHAWSNKNSALTKIKLPCSIYKTMHDYIIHPCIIDACLQSCIAIGSTDPERKVIPIGIETVRLNQISSSISCLYGYAETTGEAQNTCDVRLLDDNGHVIMYLHGFLVHEMAKANRQPVFERSIYELNWKDDAKESEQKTQCKSLSKSKWLILSFPESPHLGNACKALEELQVNGNGVEVHEMSCSDVSKDFEAQLKTKIEDMAYPDDQELIILNLLPAMSQKINCEGDMLLSAQWLCFESTLETLKAVSALELKACRIITVTCNSIGVDAFDVGSTNSAVPWAATSWGLSRVTNLETKIPVICIDVAQRASKDDFITAFNSLDDRSIEEGLVLTGDVIQRPLFERVLPCQESDGEPTMYKNREGSDNVYLSWSESSQKFCLKADAVNKPKLPDGYIDMKVKYVSTSTGQVSLLLDNIKSENAESYFQSAVGVITEIKDQRSSFKVGDDVIAVFNSKWVKDNIRLPTYNFFRKPEFLSPERSAALPSCLALAHNILTKIQNIRSGIKSVFIAATTLDRGLAWALAVLARGKKLVVTFNDHASSDLVPSAGEKSLSEIAVMHMKGSGSMKSGFDCVICPSDLHPVDREALMNSVHMGGVLAVIDIKSKQAPTQYTVNSSITILNVKPLITQLSYNEVTTALEESLVLIKSPDQCRLPEVDCIDVAKLCTSDAEACYNSNAFSCLNIAHDESSKVEVAPPSMDVQGLKEDRSYIVVGGNRGLGLYTVKWMAARGAGTIITIGRSQPPPETEADFKAMKSEFGVDIKCLQADVGTSEGIKALENFLIDLPPVAGVVNSAAVLDDKLFKDVDRENYRKVMAPKICGTLFLHNMLQKSPQDVDFFVLYSSITSVLGNAGQTTYSAANAFMNSFADYRKKVIGRNCLAICWGAMGGAGILERNTKVADLLEKSGLHLLSIPKGLEWMDSVLTTMPGKSNICICDVDWMTFLHSLPTRKSQSIIYDAIRKELPETESSSGGQLLEMVLNAKSMEKKREIVLQFIVRWLATWIGGLEEEIDLNVPLFTYGIDSVGASVLKNQIEKELQIDFEVFYYMQPETTAYKLAEDLVKAICDKFINNKDKQDQEDDEECCADEDDEPLIEEEPEDKLVLPGDYLNAIYNPKEAIAKLFLVHPSHRYSGVFQSMATGLKFQRMFSLYAFGSPDPAYLGEDVGSVDRLAKACIEMLLKIQPRGPYFLGGYSFGGLVALEMATMLEKSGEKVALVIMIDTVRWLPPARSNSHLLLEMFDTKFVVGEHIEEQMKSFLRRIATNELRIAIEEYKEMAAVKSVEEIADVLIEKAKELSVQIPDVYKILESTVADQAMASRCHNAWIPPRDLYRGHLVYIEAEDDRFCRKVTGIGSSADSWSSVFHGKSAIINCSGDHYSMMDPNRSPDVGKMIAVTACMRFRNLYPMFGKLHQANSSQTSLLTFFKSSGLRLCMIRKIAGKELRSFGTLKVNIKETKLKFKPEVKSRMKCKIKLKDVMAILEVQSFKVNKQADKNQLFAGLDFVTKKNQRYSLLCHNRQEFFRLVSLLQIIYKVSLPF
eukprot:gene13962-15419_t